MKINWKDKISLYVQWRGLVTPLISWEERIPQIICKFSSSLACSVSTGMKNTMVQCKGHRVKVGHGKPFTFDIYYDFILSFHAQPCTHYFYGHLIYAYFLYHHWKTLCCECVHGVYYLHYPMQLHYEFIFYGVRILSHVILIQ